VGQKKYPINTKGRGGKGGWGPAQPRSKQTTFQRFNKEFGGPQYVDERQQQEKKSTFETRRNKRERKPIRALFDTARWHGVRLRVAVGAPLIKWGGAK